MDAHLRLHHTPFITAPPTLQRPHQLLYIHFSSVKLLAQLATTSAQSVKKETSFRRQSSQLDDRLHRKLDLPAGWPSFFGLLGLSLNTKKMVPADALSSCCCCWYSFIDWEQAGDPQSLAVISWIYPRGPICLKMTVNDGPVLL